MESLVIVDERTIRYYTTIGLLEAPLRMDGRRAMYGLRHLLQILAIKRLQTDDVQLAVIARMMKNVSDERLARIAGLAKSAAMSAFSEAASVRHSEVTRTRRSVSSRKQSSKSQTDIVTLRVARGVYLTIDKAVATDAERVKKGLKQVSSKIDRLV